MPNQKKPGRPQLNRSTKRISLIVPTSLYRWVKNRAANEQRSLNATIIKMLEALKAKP